MPESIGKIEKIMKKVAENWHFSIKNQVSQSPREKFYERLAAFIASSGGGQST
jgi:hypothetical protein